MANALLPSNLLDGVVFSGSSHGEGRLMLVEDCVETSGAFVVHHLLKRSLSPHSSDVVVLLSFAHPFSHYDRILRKMGCNLSVQRDGTRLLFIGMLMVERLSVIVTDQKLARTSLFHSTERFRKQSRFVYHMKADVMLL